MIELQRIRIICGEHKGEEGIKIPGNDQHALRIILSDGRLVTFSIMEGQKVRDVVEFIEKISAEEALTNKEQAIRDLGEAMYREGA